jgi:hypothetical protein
MKITAILFLLGYVVAYSQTNTFPATGNVGIGTTTPGYNLDIYTSSSYEGIQLKHSSGKWLRFFSPALLGGSYNSITAADDSGIIFGSSSANATDVGFVIAPWRSDVSGLRVSSEGNVGIGTASPSQKLHVKGRIYLEGTDSYPSGWLQNYFHWRGHSLIMGSEIGEYAHNMIELKPGGSTSGTLDSYFQMFRTPSPNNHELKIQLASYGESFFNGGNVGIGTTTPDSKLTVKGHIHAEEVRVDLNVPGPDYVFEENYNLPSLTEVESYIKANKHLPEIPSAKEMEEKGINLSEMNMLLLKKVEELTLYILQQEKRITELELNSVNKN